MQPDSRLAPEQLQAIWFETASPRNGVGAPVSDLSDQLLAAIRREYALPWNGTHGVSHWGRVRENGLRLAETTGADRQVVELFAYLHDSKRRNERRDPGHGARAAEFVRTLQGSLIDLSEESLELLVYACTYHTDGLTEAQVTVQTCWDADRLDLGRVGIRPQACYLCTPAAKDADTIEWAFARSRQTRRRAGRVHSTGRESHDHSHPDH
jgi:uncharacterized protein